MDFSAESRFLPCRWGAFLRVTGDDAPSFLQGQFSQDLRGLKIGEAPAYGLLLSHKGRVQADAFILRTVDGYRLASYACPGDSLRSRLESFIIADDVIVEDQTADYAGLAVLGGAQPTSPEGGFVFPGRRANSPNWEIIYPMKSGQAPYTPPGREEPPAFWEALRIRSGIPAVPLDVGPGDLPQEAGLTAAAVSFDKGCYLGQEIMARLKTRGRIRRGLRQVTGSLVGLEANNGSELSPFAKASGDGRVLPLLYDGKPVGELRSAVAEGPANWIGLAMVLVDVPHDAVLNLEAAPIGPSTLVRPLGH